MKQRREPMELPLMELVYLPGDPLPVVISLPGDFELTGECNIYPLASTEQLEEVQRLLIFITNNVADLLWERKRQEPPFVPTGKLSPDGEQPTE